MSSDKSGGCTKVGNSEDPSQFLSSPWGWPRLGHDCTLVQLLPLLSPVFLPEVLVDARHNLELASRLKI